MAAAATTAARDGQTALALRLVKHLASHDTATVTVNGNVVFSPVSVHASLAQLLAFLGTPSAEELADFGRNPEAAAKTINEWVKKATDNLIDSIISSDDINATMDLVLANAVYFKGDWSNPFHTLMTRQGKFYLLDGRHAEVRHDEHRLHGTVQGP
ncbi:hypothetical protein PR202_gb13103 [Eleusine coracana subsp. coracana]|uniref:Serpin domain-containing protein n=1 Tax=Eleusine coracana subsp. coracana TaxID=191504 RepID=A0AAV5ERM3_ELECO|nr:hypothetical protein PR202_gb13103 [Eleusine coracana subsp. coracana]